MKVWTLEHYMDYEGGQIIGVYSDKEKAREAAAEYLRKSEYVDSLAISEMELDAPAAWRDAPCWMTRGKIPFEWKRD